MSMRRTAAAFVLSTALATVGALAPVSTAGAVEHSDRAAAKGCVSKKEYRKLKKGMTIAKVKRITGTAGKQTVGPIALPDGQWVVGRAYKVCTSKKGAVGISFKGPKGKYRLASKSAVWR